MARICLVLTLLLSSLTLGWSQDTRNPFDIRRSKSSTKTAQVKDSVSLIVKDTLDADTIINLASDTTRLDTLITPFTFDSLPIADTLTSSIFDVLSDTFRSSAVEDDSAVHDAPPKDEDDTSGIISESIHNLGDQLSELDYRIDSRLLFGFSIGLLLLLGGLLTINRSLIRKAYRAIANDNYLRFLYREYKSMPWMYWLFYLYFVLTFGFFLYLFAHYLGFESSKGIIFLLGVIVTVGIIYIVRHLSLQVMSILFPVEKEAHLYGFVTMLLNIILGIVISPINLLIAFGPPSITKSIVWMGVGIIIAIYLFRQLKGLFISGRFLYQYRFHFFLYLCTAEIAPLLIIVKLALGKLGVQ